MIKRTFQNNEGISPVLGFILILAISVTLLTTVQLSFVPVWNTQEELDHIKLMQDDLKVLKSNIESVIQSGTTLSSPLSMGFKYSPKMLVYNPKDEAYASLEISNNTWIEIRYNELFPEGMADDTNIKNVSTSKIIYSLRGAQKYNSFIFENGLIRRSGSDYTTNSQTVLANSTIFLPSLKALEYGSLSGVEKRTVNIYPTSQQKNSIIGNNVWLILHTDPDYVDWWKTNLEKEGATVRKKDRTNGIVIANISSSLVIKMGEAYISTSQKASPPHSRAKRIVKVSGTGASLPVGGTTSITVEVQDEYNNPVPNVLVSFSPNMSTIGRPSNSYSNATISPVSALSGSDGRASVTLTANDAGFYYIDASLTGYKTTLVYSASSQGGVMKLDYLPKIPNSVTYDVTARLTDSFGSSPPPGSVVTFDTSDGFVSPAINTTGSGGIYSTILNVSNATGIKITNIKLKDTSRYSANITWDTNNNITVTAKSGNLFNSINVPTNVDTYGCVFYGSTPGNHSTQACDVSGSSHTAALNNLLSGTPYYFIINGSRPGGSNMNTTEYMFVTEGTGDDTPPASVTGLTAANGSLNIFWTWIDPEDADFDHVEIKIDDEGTIYTRGKGIRSFNATYLMPNSYHNISIRTVDTSNNANATWVKHNSSTRSLLNFIFSFSNSSGLGIVTGDSNAQNDSDGDMSALLNETSTSGSSMTENYTYVSGNNVNTGTLGSFANMQSASDGGAFATLTEAATVTTRTNRTNNPGKTINIGSQLAIYDSSYLDVADSNIDITISNITQTKSIIKHASANPSIVIGTLNSGGYSNTILSDNSYVQYRELFGCTSCALDLNWNNWEAVTEISNSSIIEMDIGIEAYLTSTADNEAAYIQLWDYPNNNWNITWHQLGSSGLPSSDLNAVLWYNITNANEIQRFVNATGNYKIRFADANVAIGSTDTVRTRFYIDEFKAIFKYNLYTLNASYTFTETNSSSTWQSVSIIDSSYGDPLTNVSILNSTSGNWESILTGAFTGGASPAEHVNVIKGANGNASSYATGGNQIKLMYNWTDAKFNNTLGIDLINVTVAYAASTYNLNITTNTTNVPEDITSNHYLEINYSRDAGEPGYDVYVYNGNDWNLKGSLTSSPWTVANFTLASSEIINGNVNVLYLDQTPTGAAQGNLYIDYQRVHDVTPAVPAGYHLDIRTNHTGIPDAASHKLQIRYNASSDNFTLQVYNGSTFAWDNKADLNITSSMISIEVPLNADYLLSDGDFGSYTVHNLPKYYVDVRYVDKRANAPGGKLYLDYQRVNSS